MGRRDKTVLVSPEEVTELVPIVAKNPKLIDLSNRLMDLDAENSIDDSLETDEEILRGMVVTSRNQ